MRTGNTVGRTAVTALLAAHKRGLLLAEVHSMAATASRISTAARLARMRVSGLVITVGCGTQTLGGLECNRPAMLSRLGAMRAVVYRRRRRQENVRNALDRACKLTQRTKPADAVRRFPIPAVNSVWALAA